MTPTHLLIPIKDIEFWLQQINLENYELNTCSSLTDYLEKATTKYKQISLNEDDIEKAALKAFPRQHPTIKGCNEHGYKQALLDLLKS